MATAPLSLVERDEVLSAYVETAAWTMTSDGRGFKEYDTFTLDDLDEPTAGEMIATVGSFLDLIETNAKGDPALTDPWADLSPGGIGHSLWLTSGGHGAGFWDMGLGARGYALTRWAKTFSPPNIYYTDEDGTEWTV